MIKLDVEIKCPNCGKHSTVEDWDEKTIEVYTGYNPCLIQVGEYIDEFWFTCPKCDNQIDGEEILEFLKENKIMLDK